MERLVIAFLFVIFYLGYFEKPPIDDEAVLKKMRQDSIQRVNDYRLRQKAKKLEEFKVRAHRATKVEAEVYENYWENPEPEVQEKFWNPNHPDYDPTYKELGLLDDWSGYYD